MSEENDQTGFAHSIHIHTALQKKQDRACQKQLIYNPQWLKKFGFFVVTVAKYTKLENKYQSLSVFCCPYVILKIVHVGMDESRTADQICCVQIKQPELAIYLQLTILILLSWLFLLRFFMFPVSPVFVILVSPVAILLSHLAIVLVSQLLPV